MRRLYTERINFIVLFVSSLFLSACVSAESSDCTLQLNRAMPRDRLNLTVKQEEKIRDEMKEEAQERTGGRGSGSGSSGKGGGRGGRIPWLVTSSRFLG